MKKRRHLSELRFETPVTFFVGEKGSGKSTLLEEIAVAFGVLRVAADLCRIACYRLQ